MGKPRGRRIAIKERQKTHEIEENSLNECSKSEASEVIGFSGNETNGSQKGQDPNTFFGVLNTEELEYFKQAESTLAIDAFESPEEKEAFIRGVIEESKKKELKLATSQICSKLMERIILAADNLQLKEIFETFHGFFYNLACHKYSSHVLETVLVRSASLVEKELLTPSFEDSTNTMEQLFLRMVDELEPHFRAMVSHRYASHVLRLVLLIISSKTLPSTTLNNSSLRSKKSKIARKMIDIKDNEDFNRVYRTPDSFKIKLRAILASFYKDLSGGGELGSSKRGNVDLTSITKVRELCIDPVASPVLQLVIQIEGIFDRDRSFWHLIFSSTDEKDPKEEAFVEYLLSNSVGSHFLQNVVSSSRPKYTERLFSLYMKDRVVKLARRDSTGVFVIQALLKHLHQNEVRSLLMDLVPELQTYLDSHLDFCTEIVDCSIRQDNFMRDQIIEQLLAKFGSQKENKSGILETCLHLSSSTLGNTKGDWPTAEERRRSLFLEKLIDYDDKFLNMTIDGFLDLPHERLLQMCYHGVFSRVVEHTLQVKRVEKIKRKLLLNIFCTDTVNLACNAYGSHLVDKLWDFSAQLTMYKERIATSLTNEATKVKNSVYGRQTWKNWSLDNFLRKRYDWKKIIRDQESELFPEAAYRISSAQGSKKRGPRQENALGSNPKRHRR
ncbi:LAMI_0F11980g1_1 [Lachancea mirantina]|uniref:Nucleolar protein 9 n=1 Tax=Lachancea mirantina TaxID=1230905 RepID=A0A1G4K2P8_9SACH|nr:LAMI_0F11980g1_1 [Lachancea mirantina]